MYPVNKGTFAKILRLEDIKDEDMLGMCPINIRINISKLPNIKLKHVTTSPPNFLVLFFPKTPYKANVIAAKSVNIIPIGESFIDKGLIIIKIPKTSKIRDTIL